MAKFSYLDHVYEVVRVAEELPCSFGEAWDRFRADVKAGAAHEYNTGDALEFFNFAHAGELWNGMTEEEQEQAREEWRRAMCKETGAYNRELILKLVEAYREQVKVWTF